MNYPNNPQRYGALPPNLGQPTHVHYPSPRTTRRGSSFTVHLIVGLLGVIIFVLGFAPYTKLSTTSTPLPNADGTSSFFSNSGVAGVAGLALVLAAGLIALFGLLPNQTPNGSTVAGLSLAGLLSLVCVMIGLDVGMDVGVGLILVTVGAFLQVVLACGSVLITAGVLRIGTPTANPMPPTGGRSPFQHGSGPR